MDFAWYGAGVKNGEVHAAVGILPAIVFCDLKPGLVF